MVRASGREDGAMKYLAVDVGPGLGDAEEELGSGGRNVKRWVCGPSNMYRATRAMDSIAPRSWRRGWREEEGERRKERGVGEEGAKGRRRGGSEEEDTGAEANASE